MERDHNATIVVLTPNRSWLTSYSRSIQFSSTSTFQLDTYTEEEDKNPSVPQQALKWITKYTHPPSLNSKINNEQKCARTQRRGEQRRRLSTGK